MEDQSIRTITNPSPTEPLRVDIHQLIRDWRVDLYRYGLRLTYNIVVPAPGIDLLANVDELRRIDHQLGQTFTFTLPALRHHPGQVGVAGGAVRFADVHRRTLRRCY